MSTSNVEINIIMTYQYIEQETFTIVVDRNIVKRSFIEKIINKSQNGRFVIKISCYQLNCNSYNDLIYILRNNYGKFYFNSEVNYDSDTIENQMIRNNFYANNN